MTDHSHAQPTNARALLRAWAEDATAAAIFLTRLPIRWRGDWPDGLHARSQRAFPLVGAAIGLAGGAAYAAAAWIGLPPLPAAILAVAAQIALTGALHEDGLADVADGFGGGRDRQRKLDIMRDSRVGSYGALALVAAVGLRAAALAALASPVPVTAALVAGGALSRGVLPAMPHWLKPARTDGVAATAGRPGVDEAVIAAALGGTLTLLAAGFAAGTVALVIGTAAAAATGWLARRQIGGYTGDVLGTAQQAVEIAVLLTLVAAA
ncbi:MAG TPA: adenosylcobinamide-GDP ribazoletransferase [Alphaproteobacteria bacterium]|nr:adenosylcobinamide-GDP ribazoletransferase [Alphaproteobacteria bacterium]